MRAGAKARASIRLLAVVGAVLCLYVLGFVVFLLMLPAPLTALPGVKADGIVALTGEITRLGPAVALLEQGNGERLLITGVNRATRKSELRLLLDGKSQFDCCVDLGFDAVDTHGNAAEAAAWARLHGYKSLIVVTADYHMPRSLLEFSTQMPDVRLVPYAVAPERTDLPLKRKLPRLLGEYAKYLASWAQYVLLNGNETTQPSQASA